MQAELFQDVIEVIADLCSARENLLLNLPLSLARLSRLSHDI